LVRRSIAVQFKYFHLPGLSSPLSILQACSAKRLHRSAAFFAYPHEYGRGSGVARDAHHGKSSVKFPNTTVRLGAVLSQGRCPT